MNDNDKICEKIKRTISKYNMFSENDTVVVGVSGGADSMALLQFLLINKDFYRINIVAAHINHCLRGAEADRDENFVRNFCDKNGVELKVLKINVKDVARKEKTGVEECARSIRYHFFEEVKNAKIATAHTLSDSAETVVLNLVRGAGTKGICGIPAVRGKIIRPLIDLKRSETEEFCRSNGIDFVVDSTNLSRDYSRNKIRLDVVPVLKSINPSFEDSINRLTEIMKEDEEYFEKEVNKIIEGSKIEKNIYDLKKIWVLPVSLKKRVIIKVVSDSFSKGLEQVHVDLILDAIGKKNGLVNLPGNFYVKVEKEQIIFLKEINNITKEKFEKPLLPLDDFTFNEKKLSFKIVSKKEYEEKKRFNKLLFINAIDCGTINNSTVVRSRASGDRFCKFGRNATKTVKKLFNEEKIPADQRDKILMLANGNDVLWIENSGVSSAAAVTDKTEKVILIFLEENKDVK